MNMAEIMEQVHKKGRNEEAFRLITEYVPKLSTDAKKEFCHKLEGIAYALTPEEAKQIVSHMIPYGEHWSCDKVKEYLIKKDATTEHLMYYYLVMNMTYNDYMNTAITFSLKDNPDFFYSLAKDFINDADAAPYKVEKYFSM